jgi:molybdate transport system substrate-binding protein
VRATHKLQTFRFFGTIALISFACVLATGGVHGQETSLSVSAAASLRESIGKLAQAFEKENSGVKIRVNLGGSNLLARQIEAGAPVDVFLSADAPTMNKLQEAKLIEANSRFDLLGNTLVAVAPANSNLEVKTPADLASESVRRVAICERAVPAGHYAESCLKHFALLEKLENRIVRTEDVRAALAAVQNGHADLGFVYGTDAKITDKVRIVWEAPRKSHEPIVYPAAMTSRTTSPELARKFLDYLRGAEARRVFTEAGFQFLPAPAQ